MKGYWIGIVVCLGAIPLHAEETAKMPSWGVELNLGPYRPPSPSPGYNKAYFGNDRPWIKALEADRYLLEFFGLWGVYGRAGHWSASGKSQVCNSGGTTGACTPATVSGGTDGNTTTSFTVIPLSLGVIYKMNLLQKHLQFPLTVYGKLAYDYFFWSIKSDNDTAVRGTRQGKGATPGYHGTVGIALGLDWIDPRPNTSIFLNSYLFVEVSRYVVDGFKQFRNTNKLDLSSTAFISGGLSFDFD